MTRCGSVVLAQTKGIQEGTLRIFKISVLVTGLMLFAIAQSASADLEAVDTKNVITALRAAIQEDQLALAACNRQKNPNTCATLNSKLGHEHFRLATLTREIGLFEKSVADFDAALEVWTKKTDGELWGMTQLSRADALMAVGENRTEAHHLEMAVEAYHAALEVFTPTRHARQYAGAQNDLAETLFELGAMEHTPRRLQEGIVSAKAALDTWQRVQDRRNWVITRAVLAASYFSLGNLTKNDEYVRQAVDIERAVLEVRDIKFEARQYVSWAATLGEALTELGVRERDVKKLDEAAEVLRHGLTRNLPDGVTPSMQFNAALRTQLQADLGLALEEQAIISVKPQLLYDSVAAYEASLHDWPPKIDTDRWALTQASYADALLKLAVIYRLPDRFLAANAAFRAALGVFSPGHLPQYYVRANSQLGTSLLQLAIATHKKEYAEQSLLALNAALSVRQGDPQLQFLIVRAKAEVIKLQTVP